MGNEILEVNVNYCKSNECKSMSKTMSKKLKNLFLDD